MTIKGKWWQEAVVYQIYPRSFNDTNGDGIGDLKGIIEKLDYLKDLGVTAIWICPFYESPMDDNGYDVSNFYKVAEEYGSISDVGLLIEEMHKRDMKLIIDLVLNHTSDEHPWFIESKKRKEDNVYRDFYIWKPKGENGGKPTNWESFFGGSVWEYDEETEEYYMHIFSKKMPDLNWRNDKMRKAMHEMTEWWLELGVDGFRVDAVAHLDRNWDFPNGHLTKGRKYAPEFHQFSNRPKVHDYIKEMNEFVFSKYDIMTVGEAGGATIEDALKYCAYDRHEFNMLLTFDHTWLDSNVSEEADVLGGSKWAWTHLNLPELKKTLANWQNKLQDKAWNTLYWSNHDQPRIISHYGNDDPKYRVLSAKMLATILYFMGGTPYIYQGEEIGMTNVHFDDLDDYRDVEVFTLYEEQVRNGELSHEDVMNRIHHRSRDNARTPMQWNDTEHAGFTNGQVPWMKVNPNYKTINVKNAMNDHDSIYHFYKSIFRIRQASKCLIYGDFKLYLEDDANIVMYTRKDDYDYYLVIANFFQNDVTVNLPKEVHYNASKLILSNYKEKKMLYSKMMLRPYEALVYKLV